MASSARLEQGFEEMGYPPFEAEGLAELVDMFTILGPPPDPFGLYPRYTEMKERLRAAIRVPVDMERIEEALLELYCHLHCNEAPYSRDERKVVNETGGYWCHAGGLSPVLKAGPHLDEQSTSIDLGAGNGLQGLLMQRLYPHRSTILVEISSKLIEAGRMLQDWLGITGNRIEWVAGDLSEFELPEVDLVYMYRPLKPEGIGRDFYRSLAQGLLGARRSIVVLSVADCLYDLVAEQFQVFYFDGHLKCYRKDANLV